MARVQHQHAGRAQQGPSQRKKKPYKVILESITTEKKKLQKTVSFCLSPPPGYTFVAAGTPDLTERCKELCRRKNLQVHVVNMKPKNRDGHNPEKVSHHILRIGHHFPTTVVDNACTWFGYIFDPYRKVFTRSRNFSGTNLFERRLAIRSQGLVGLDKQPLNDSIPAIRAAVRDLFPKIPETDIDAIISRAFEEGAKTVGNATNLSLASKVQLAVCAHIRHVYTDYDKLLRQKTWIEARADVEQEILAQMKSWRDETENDTIELEEAFREVIVLDDDEDGPSDGEESSEDEASMEIVSSPAAAQDLPVNDLPEVRFVERHHRRLRGDGLYDHQRQPRILYVQNEAKQRSEPRSAPIASSPRVTQPALVYTAHDKLPTMVDHAREHREPLPARYTGDQRNLKRIEHARYSVSNEMMPQPYSLADQPHRIHESQRAQTQVLSPRTVLVHRLPQREEAVVPAQAAPRFETVARPMQPRVNPVVHSVHAHPLSISEKDPLTHHQVASRKSVQRPYPHFQEHEIVIPSIERDEVGASVLNSPRATIVPRPPQHAQSANPVPRPLENSRPSMRIVSAPSDAAPMLLSSRSSERGPPDMRVVSAPEAALPVVPARPPEYSNRRVVAVKRKSWPSPGHSDMYLSEANMTKRQRHSPSTEPRALLRRIPEGACMQPDYYVVPHSDAPRRREVIDLTVGPRVDGRPPANLLTNAPNDLHKLYGQSSHQPSRTQFSSRPPVSTEPIADPFSLSPLRDSLVRVHTKIDGIVPHDNIQRPAPVPHAEHGKRIPMAPPVHRCSRAIQSISSGGESHANGNQFAPQPQAPAAPLAHGSDAREPLFVPNSPKKALRDHKARETAKQSLGRQKQSSRRPRSNVYKMLSPRRSESDLTRRRMHSYHGIHHQEAQAVYENY